MQNMYIKINLYDSLLCSAKYHKLMRYNVALFSSIIKTQNDALLVPSGMGDDIVVI